jgi:hypothetical protein
MNNHHKMRDHKRKEKALNSMPLVFILLAFLKEEDIIFHFSLGVQSSNLF